MESVDCGQDPRDDPPCGSVREPEKGSEALGNKERKNSGVVFPAVPPTLHTDHLSIYT